MGHRGGEGGGDILGLEVHVGANSGNWLLLKQGYCASTRHVQEEAFTDCFKFKEPLSQHEYKLFIVRSSSFREPLVIEGHKRRSA